MHRSHIGPHRLPYIVHIWCALRVYVKGGGGARGARETSALVLFQTKRRKHGNSNPHVLALAQCTCRVFQSTSWSLTIISMVVILKLPLAPHLTDWVFWRRDCWTFCTVSAHQAKRSWVMDDWTGPQDLVEKRKPVKGNSVC